MKSSAMQRMMGARAPARGALAPVVRRSAAAAAAAAQRHDAVGASGQVPSDSVPLPRELHRARSARGRTQAVAESAETAADARPSASEASNEGLRGSPRPMKVIIAGGGIGGLVLAVALLKKGVEVQVYERDLTAIRGEGKYRGPIQVQSNALAALEAIDPDMASEVMAAGCITGDRINGLCDGVTGDWYTKFDTFHPAVDRGLPVTRVISRVTLQQILQRHAERLAGPGVVQNSANVVSYDDGGAGPGRPGSAGVRVELEDGRVETADLLIGADGIWSRVRKALVGETQPTYSGYTCYTGISDYTPPDLEIVGYRVFLGNGKYFVSSDVGGGKQQWYAFHQEPAGGSDTDGERKERLLGLFGHWCDNVVDLIKATPEDDILRRDIFDRPPIFRWHRGRVALLGDSAHAMQPNLGQGGCMAIEDAFNLADNIEAALERVEHDPARLDVGSVLSTYQFERLGRASAIHGMARMAAIMASTYKAYLGEGLGPLEALTELKVPHPGRVGGQAILHLTMPAVLEWVLGGNVRALERARPAACPVQDGLKVFSEADFETFMRDDDALLRSVHARWLLVHERRPAAASGADATSSNEAKGVYLPGGGGAGGGGASGGAAGRQQGGEPTSSAATAADAAHEVVVGSSAEAGAQLLLASGGAEGVAARHARVWRDAPSGDYFIEDLGAPGSGGTWHNGRPLAPHQRARLLPQDVIEFGAHPSAEPYRIKLQHVTLYNPELSGTSFRVIPVSGSAAAAARADAERVPVAAA